MVLPWEQHCIGYGQIKWWWWNIKAFGRYILGNHCVGIPPSGCKTEKWKQQVEIRLAALCFMQKFGRPYIINFLATLCTPANLPSSAAGSSKGQSSNRNWESLQSWQRWLSEYLPLLLGFFFFPMSAEREEISCLHWLMGSSTKERVHGGCFRLRKVKSAVPLSTKNKQPPDAGIERVHSAWPFGGNTVVL